VVASDALGDAYIVPMHAVFRDIKNRLSAFVTLPILKLENDLSGCMAVSHLRGVSGYLAPSRMDIEDDDTTVPVFENETPHDERRHETRQARALMRPADAASDRSASSVHRKTRIKSLSLSR
jgi:hypothetical protein